jgi:phosphoglycerate dehydrogenase-like enzyme
MKCAVLARVQCYQLRAPAGTRHNLKFPYVSNADKRRWSGSKRRMRRPSVPLCEHAAVMATIGLIGAGHIGSQVARLAVANGYNVVITNSRAPETLSELVAELGPKARAATVLEAARSGDIVVRHDPDKELRHSAR